MKPRVVCSSLSFAALFGCSAATVPTEDGFSLIPTKSVYAAGETVSAQLVNRSVEPIGFGACSIRLERREGSAWSLIGPQEVPCIMILYVLQPGNARSFNVPLDSGLQPGTYHLRQEILPGTHLPARTIYSPEFRLQSAS